MLTFFTMLRPTMASERPWRAAMSITCWMRWMWLANDATMMRPLASAKMLSSRCPTLRSGPVYPGLSALVLSDSSSSTPCRPSSANR